MKTDPKPGAPDEPSPLYRINEGHGYAAAGGLEILKATAEGFDPAELGGDTQVETTTVTRTGKTFVNPLRINLGSGADPLPNFVNVDMLDRPDVDIVHNLMDFPYPFEDESATEIRGIDVVEHLDNFTDDKRPAVVAFIEECYRILKPGGELYLQTPGYQAAFRWTDPTHVRPFTAETFTLWDEDTPYGATNGYYSHAHFKVRVEELENHNLRIWLTKR